MLNILHYVTCLLIAANCIVMAIAYKRLSTPFKILMVQTIIALIIETIAMQLKQHGYKNVPLFNGYLLVETSLLLLALKYWQAPPAKLIPAFFLVFLGIWSYSIYSNGLYQFAQNALLTSSVIICCCSLLFAIKLYTSGVKLLTDARFWIILGLLLYFGGTVPLFSLFDYLISGSFIHSAKPLYAINGVLAIVRYVCCLIGISFLYKKKNRIPDRSYDYTHTV